MEELGLKGIFNIFWRRKVGIMIILLLSIITGAIYSFYMVKPVYTSYISMLLIPENIEKQNGIETISKEIFTINSTLVETYGELIKKNDILQQVLEELEIKDMSIQDIKNKIETVAVTDTGVIQITVTNSNPEYAAKIANKIAEIFEEKIADVYIENSVSIVDNAEVNFTPSNINHKRDMIVVTFIGIVIAFGYVLVRYMWEDSSNKLSEK